MMSGMRNAPPISTSSPRETTTSLRAASADSAQQHGGRVVVDHGGRLGAGQFADQPVDQVVAIAAPAGGQVELEVHRPRQRGRHGLHRLVGQQRAAEVGMQHRAGQVEHRLHRAGVGRGEPRGHLGGDAGLVGRHGARRIAPRRLAPGVERGAHGRQHARAAVRIDQRSQRRGRDQPLDRGHARQQGVQFIEAGIAQGRAPFTMRRRKAARATARGSASCAGSRPRSSAGRA